MIFAKKPGSLNDETHQSLRTIFIGQKQPVDYDSNEVPAVFVKNQIKTSKVRKKSYIIIEFECEF